MSLLPEVDVSFSADLYRIEWTPTGQLSWEPSGHVTWDQGKRMLSFLCPHCWQPVYVTPEDVNCRIFRHGFYKHNGQQLPPHLHKQECDRLAQEGLIEGCGKPFELLPIPDQKAMYRVVACAYK